MKKIGIDLNIPTNLKVNIAISKINELLEKLNKLEIIELEEEKNEKDSV